MGIFERALSRLVMSVPSSQASDVHSVAGCGISSAGVVFLCIQTPFE